MLKIKDLQKKKSTKKEIAKKVEKTCACCGKKIRVIIYKDKTYRGGHYFGKIPLCTKKAWKEAKKAGTHKAKFGNHDFTVLNKDPKPYDYIEYWECSKCYRL